MAINDITIGQLPELSSVTDDTLFTVVKDGLNYKLKYSTFKPESMALGEMSTQATSSPVTYDGNTYTKVEVFDKVQYEDGVLINIANHQIEILSDGDYMINVDINVSFNNTQGAEFALLIDGVVEENLGTIQGRGNNKPVYLSATDIDPLTAGQVVTLGVKDDEDGSIDITFYKARIIVEKIR